MPRQTVKHAAQEKLCTWVDKSSMEAAREVKGITDRMIADQVRAALFLYYSMMRQQGVIPMTPGGPTRDVWPELPQEVSDALGVYVSRFTDAVCVHKQTVEKAAADPEMELMGKLRNIVVRYYGEKTLKVGGGDGGEVVEGVGSVGSAR